MPAGRSEFVTTDSAQRRSERVYDALKDMILQTDVYAPAARLQLSEQALAAQFGVSRSPLRLALARLDHEGLVKIYKRRGIFIVRKSKAQIVEMITAWAALESMAARMVAAQSDAGDIAILRGISDRFHHDGGGRDVNDYIAANIEFHSAIIRLSKSRLICDLTDGLLLHVRAIKRRGIAEADRARQSVRDHKDIVAALEARDGEMAGTLVRNHAFRLRDYVHRLSDLN
jgi:DNA-binding GntR family transcriptional regulator